MCVSVLRVKDFGYAIVWKVKRDPTRTRFRGLIVGNTLEPRRVGNYRNSRGKGKAIYCEYTRNNSENFTLLNFESLEICVTKLRKKVQSFFLKMGYKVRTSIMKMNFSSASLSSRLFY